jgi:hypothetical protein
MIKEGWHSLKGVKVLHYLPILAGRYTSRALCGAQETVYPWKYIKGYSPKKRCEHCDAILKKKEKSEMKEEGWHARDIAGVKISHYIKMHEGGELYTSALCGANAGQEGWGSTAGTRQCKRCLAALEKMPLKETPELEPEIKNPKAFDMQVQYNQVVGETIPLTWIPVPDVKKIIDLLKSIETSDACLISRAVVWAAIQGLQARIKEAEERCSRPDTVTTWRHEGEKED